MSIQQNYPVIRPTLNLDFANTKQLDPRITFTRASTATFYDGKTVAKAEENLLLRSQEFDSGWSKVGLTVTDDTLVAPDGTITAYKVTADAGSASRAVATTSLSTAGTTRTFSFFVKQGTHQFIQLAFFTDIQAFANFDVTSGSGSIGTVGASATASITLMTNDFYRCSITTSSLTAGTGLGIYIVSSSNAPRAETWTAMGTETVFIWGAQLEQRSFVTAYTPTTTAPITNYIPVLQTASTGTPRFDHNPITGESLGLLIEEQRTNLLLRSEEFDAGVWTKSNSRVTANATISPNGTFDADKLLEDTSNSTHGISQLPSLTATTHTFTVYAKAAERNWIRVTCVDGVAFVNLSSGVFGVVSVGTVSFAAKSITAVGNGWYRVEVSFTAASGANTVLVRLATSDGNHIYTGDGYSGVYIWGAQVEAAPFATSYIPTVASQVTRLADAASITGTNFSSWFNQAEGTIYSNISLFNSNVGISHVWEIRVDNANRFLYQSNGGTILTTSRILGFSSNSATIILDSPATLQQSIAVAYKTNNSARSTNGASVVLDTSGSIANGMSSIHIGRAASASLNGYIKKISYYPIRLTNTQLQGITT